MCKNGRVHSVSLLMVYRGSYLYLSTIESSGKSYLVVSNEKRARPKISEFSVNILKLTVEKTNFVVSVASIE